MLDAMRRTLSLAVPLVLVAGIAAPATAATSTTGRLTVVARNLDNPRGVAIDRAGTVLVAEAGLGGDDVCIPGTFGTNLCYGSTGAITAVRHGWQKRVVTGLPSLRSTGAGFSVYGAHDLAFDRQGKLLVAMGYSTDPVSRDLLGAAGAAMGTILRVEGKHRWSVLGDLSAYEGQHNPDGVIPESQPYAVVADGRDIYALDAAANDVLRIDRRGVVTTEHVWPQEQVPAPPEWGLPPGSTTPIQFVPVTIAKGPDGALYIGQLTGHPFPNGGARVWRLVPGQEPTIYATGFTNIIDLAFDKRGRLVVLEIAKNGLSSGDSTGALIRVERDGSHRELASAGLDSPMSFAIAGDGSFYIANKGLGIGELVRLSIRD
ncbi:ScyD/ScyE family protein [Micromonospora parva]|uniref:ScyD/ScyE family protein n=1 Tax=Micromonospora parva TaxID=1464048 RepID=UPI0033E2D97E